MNGRGGGRREEGYHSLQVLIYLIWCVLQDLESQKDESEQKSGTMVLLLLEIKAELENITNLVPKGGSDGSEYTFFFKV